MISGPCINIFMSIFVSQIVHHFDRVVSHSSGGAPVTHDATYFMNRINRISAIRNKMASDSAYFHNGLPKYRSFISLLKASVEAT